MLRALLAALRAGRTAAQVAALAGDPVSDGRQLTVQNPAPGVRALALLPTDGGAVGVATLLLDDGDLGELTALLGEPGRGSAWVRDGYLVEPTLSLRGRRAVVTSLVLTPLVTTEEDRARLLGHLRDLGAARNRASGAERDRLVAEIGAVRHRYAQALPRVPVARDPATGDLVHLALDPDGLDGPCWDAENPARPADDTSARYCVTAGSMRLAGLESFQHLALPGPAVPFVVPELLARDGVVAVLATFPVGPHTGFAVTYLGPEPHADPLPNEWGRREYWQRQAGRPRQMGSSYDQLPTPDFDLAPWLEQEKLAWVETGDTALTLRWGTQDCPYLDLPGTHDFQRVQTGKVWT